MTLSWVQFGMLVIQEGFPFALELWKMMQAGGAPTAEQLAALEKLSRNNAHSKLTDALIANGIDLTSPQALALLAMSKTQ